MDKQQFLELLDVYIAGNATPQQQQQLLNWYASFQYGHQWSEEQKNALQQLENKIWNTLQQKITGEKPALVIPIYKRKWAIAASLLILITAGWLLFNTNKNEVLIADNSPVEILPANNRATLTLSDGKIITLDDSSAGIIAREGNVSIVKSGDGLIQYNISENTVGETIYNTMKTPKGGQYRLRLPDGSNVWLNAASEIRYPAVFTGTKRIVQVSGEVYFEVTKNKSQPFIVETEKNKIEVLGTEFNVNAYSDEQQEITTLIEGAVKVNNLILRPGQEILNGKITQADMDKRLAWRNGLFNFERAKLETVLKELSRWYDVEIVYEGKVPQKTFGGEMDRNLVLSQVLDILKRAGVKFRIDGRKLIVGA